MPHKRSKEGMAKKRTNMKDKIKKKKRLEALAKEEIMVNHGKMKEKLDNALHQNALLKVALRKRPDMQHTNKMSVSGKYF